MNTTANPQSATSASEDGDMIGFDLVSLARSAAQLRAGRLAFVNDAREIEEALGFAEFDAMARRFAGALHAYGLNAGDTMLIVGCMSPRSFAAVIGGLAAGIDVAVCGAHLDATAIGAFARDISASAIVVEASAQEPADCELAYGAAAAAETIRLVVSLAEDAPDGAISIEAARDAEPPAWHADKRARILTRESDGRAVAHTQQTLVTAGLDFISQTQIGAGLPIVSTIVPASFAGLICGPLAGLLTGATTIVHVPFNSERLIDRIEKDMPVQLIAPAAIARDIERSSLGTARHLSCLALLTRLPGVPEDLANLAMPTIELEGVRIADIIAFGETAVVAERRPANGARQAPLQAQHTIQMDGREVIAVRATKHLLDHNGARTTAIALEGAAVSKPDWKRYDPAA